MTFKNYKEKAYWLLCVLLMGMLILEIYHEEKPAFQFILGILAIAVIAVFGLRVIRQIKGRPLQLPGKLGEKLATFSTINREITSVDLATLLVPILPFSSDLARRTASPFLYYFFSAIEVFGIVALVVFLIWKVRDFLRIEK